MKTHDVAKALEALAKMLKAVPNQELDQLAGQFDRGKSFMTSDEIRVSLSHLAALSRVDKQEWLALVEEFGFPIKVRPRDASRDILGKLLRYLEEHEEARERLAKSRTSKQASPELLDALNTLLRDPE